MFKEIQSLLFHDQIARTKGINNAKPYQHDYRRLKNAEDDLKKT
jgi:hypothetical protein